MPENFHRDEASLATDLHIQATYRLTEALVDAENRMRRRVELLSEIVFETDRNNVLVFLNRAWSQALEHPLEQSLGRPLAEFVLPEDRAVFERTMAGVGGVPAMDRPCIRYLRANGLTAWMELSAARIADGVVGTLHDVTTEKLAQVELAKLSLVASNTDNFVLITDREGRIEWVNQAFTRRTGYTLDEMMGRKPDEVLHGPDTDQQMVAQVRAWLAEGRSFRAELLQYTRGGEPYWVSFQNSPIRDVAGRVERFVSIQTDSTQLRRTQRELEAAKEHAEQLAAEAQVANRAKSEFLATMSHEIRTPMNGILGMAELLQQTPLDSRQREFTVTIAQSGTALLRIINDILDLSKIEAGRMTFEEVEFDVRELLRGVTTVVAQAAPAKPVAVRGEADPNLPARLRGDAGRLGQVLLNLVGNGFKFTTTGSVVARVQALGRTGEQVQLRFEVTDTGVGISPDKVALLFQPFQQLDSSPARRHGGTGLGLAISRRLVELMGGRMGVVSAAGQGSTFWFELTLPLVAAPPAEPVPTTGMRVLVAQCSALNRRLSLLSLAKLGCRVVTADSGAGVLACLGRESWDAVLFDLWLPDMEGVQLAAAIRQHEAKRAAAPLRHMRLLALASQELGGSGRGATPAELTSFLMRRLLWPNSSKRSEAQGSEWGLHSDGGSFNLLWVEEGSIGLGYH